MDSIITSKIVYKGNDEDVQRFRGRGLSQMNILLNQMKFRGLKQASRYVNYPDVHIACIVCQNQFEVYIVANVPVEEEDLLIQQGQVDHLFIVYGNPAERRLILYIGDTTFIENEDIIGSDGGYGTLRAVYENTIYGSMIKCHAGEITGETSGALASIQDCKERYYEHAYTGLEILQNNLLVYPQWLEFESPVDQAPCSECICETKNACVYEWHKTYDDVVVTAFIHTPLGTDIPNPLRWSIAATYKNQILEWDGQPNDYFPSFGFSRTVCTSVSCEETSDTHIGFDLWRVDNDNEDEYYFSFISDAEATLYICKVNTVLMKVEIIESKVSACRELIWGEHPTPGYADRHARLIGYGYDQEADKHLAYWCALEIEAKYYIEDVLTESITEEDETDSGSDNTYIEHALWNPIIRDIFLLVDSNGQNETPDSSILTGAEPWRIVAWYGSTITGSYTFEGVPINPPTTYPLPGSDPSVPDTLALDLQAKDMTVNLLGEDITYSLLCNNAIGYPPQQITRTNTYWKGYARQATSKDTYGLFKIHSLTEDKGYLNTYSQQYWQTQAATFPPPGIQCVDTVWVPPTTGGSTEYGGVASDYRLVKWIFTNSGIVYEYQELPYENYEQCNTTYPTSWLGPKVKGEWVLTNCVDDVYCYGVDCPDPPDSALAWQTHSMGDSTILEAAYGVFPYDYGWEAILLHGNCLKTQGKTKATIEKEDWIIYKSLTEQNSFLVENDGTYHDFDVVARLWFQQLTKGVTNELHI